MQIPSIVPTLLRLGTNLIEWLSLLQLLEEIYMRVYGKSPFVSDEEIGFVRFV